jgi:aspartate kinase
LREQLVGESSCPSIAQLLTRSNRLLEVFALLEEVNAIKDKESSHYEVRVHEYERLVRVICDDHVAAAKIHIQDAGICEELKGAIVAECKEILDFRVAAERWHLEMDSRSKDRVISFGEKLSCRFVAAMLEDRVTLVNHLLQINY